MHWICWWWLPTRKKKKQQAPSWLQTTWPKPSDLPSLRYTVKMAGCLEPGNVDLQVFGAEPPNNRFGYLTLGFRGILELMFKFREQYEGYFFNCTLCDAPITQVSLHRKSTEPVGVQVWWPGMWRALSSILFGTDKARSHPMPQLQNQVESHSYRSSSGWGVQC